MGGLAGVVKDRSQSRYADLPAFGQRAVLVWHKYRWSCPGSDPSWTEERGDIATRYSSAMTWRVAMWATIAVGRQVRPVSQVAAELGVAWNTLMDTVTAVGAIMIDHGERIGTTTQLGVDETVFLSAGRRRRRQFVSSVTDVEARTVLDVFEGRQRAALVAWFNVRPPHWVSGVEVVVADLHEPFRAAFDECVPDAVQVADPMFFSRSVTPTGKSSRHGKRKRMFVTSTRCGVNLNWPRCGSTPSSMTPGHRLFPRSKASGAR